MVLGSTSSLYSGVSACSVYRSLAHSVEDTTVTAPVIGRYGYSNAALADSEPLEQLRGLLFSLRSDVKTLASASLTEMITVPGCKRDVWMDLQPLLQHIENAES